MKAINILLLFLILICVIPPVSAGVAQLVWTNQTTSNVCITAIDTNSLGTLILAGLGNGTILAYDATGNISWAYNTNNTAPNAAIKKIVATSNGDIAWISRANESGFVSAAGAVGGIVHDTGRNVTDVAIMSDGSLYATSELYPPRLVIHNQDGSTYAQNISFTGGNWTKIGYDPSNTWIVSANQTDDTLYFWNISDWAGWSEFNPINTLPKNASQLFLDTFPFRENISLLGAATDSKGIVFINVTNVTEIIKINASAYFYNATMMGRYFYWTTSGKMSNVSNTTPPNLSDITNYSLNNNQAMLLNLSRLDGNNYYVVFRPNFTNYTFYFGNTTFSNQVLNQTFSNNNTLIIRNLTTANTSWTAPTGVQSVNLTMYGGGGGGAIGTTNSAAGQGGRSATVTSYANVAVAAGTTYPVSIGLGGIGSNNGAATTFNNTQSATGGLAGGAGGANGQNGNTSITIPQYPTASQGGTSITSYNDFCGEYHTGTNFGTGGSGYGAGGGGGAGTIDPDTCGGIRFPGQGGQGAPGIIQISYYVNDVPQYYNGSAPITAYNFSKQTQNGGHALNQTSSKDYVGAILGLSVPDTGGLVSMATETIFYQQYVSDTGIGLTYCATLQNGAPALFAGVPNTISASNGGVASIEGRGQAANIYDSGAVARGNIPVGGVIRSVDTAMTSGVFTAFGGDEGKVYMISKQGSPTWYSYFSGSVGARMNAVAVAWDGSSVVTGRLDGTLDYYLTNVTIPVTPTPSFTDVFVYVFKDGAIYTNQTVTIYSSATDTVSWVPLGTAITDSQGRITFTTTVGTYYKFVVNNIAGTTEGEGSAIWQSNTGQNTVYIRILTPSTPYEWNAVYVSGINNVSVIYSDSVVATSVMVTITDLKTNLVVLTRTFTSTTGFNIEYHDPLGNGTYQVNILINRLGYIVRDQRIVTSPNTYGIAIPVDKYILWAISTVILMIIAGLFGYANSRRGALAVVVIAVLMMVFGLLPWTMVTVAMLAAIFAVMSLFASRVQ